MSIKSVLNKTCMLGGLLLFVPTVVRASPDKAVNLTLITPDAPEPWRKPKCGASKTNQGMFLAAWVCQSSSALDPGASDAPVPGLVRFGLTAVYVSAGLDPDDTAQQEAAARYHDDMTLTVIPPAGWPPGTKIEMHVLPHNGSEAPEGFPLIAYGSPNHPFYQLSTDVVTFSAWARDDDYTLVALNADGQKLGQWKLPRQNAAETLGMLISARWDYARADIDQELAALPATLRDPMHQTDRSSPEYPENQQNLGHEAIVVTRCQRLADGSLSGCRNLSVFGAPVFGRATLEWLRAARFTPPADDGTSHAHVSRTVFVLSPH